MQRSYRWPFVLLLSTILVGVTQMLYMPVITPLVMCWFFLVCPGIAIVGLLPVKQISIQVSLVFALSMAVNTLLAELMAFTHLWSPTSALLLIAGISLGGAMLQVWQSRQIYTK